MRNETKGWLLLTLAFFMLFVVAYKLGGLEALMGVASGVGFAATFCYGLHFLYKEDDIKFPPHTTIELGTTINITDGPYKGVWEATQGGWRKI